MYCWGTPSGKRQADAGSIKAANPQLRVVLIEAGQPKVNGGNGSGLDAQGPFSMGNVGGSDGRGTQDT